MGDRSHLPRPRLSLAAAVLLASCIDFVEPDLAERGAPAVIAITIRLLDTGLLEVNGTLAPGLDDAGFLRTLESELLRAAGFEIAPAEVERNGTRRYAFEQEVPPGSVAEPIEFRAPGVHGVVETPSALWWGARRLDADTIDYPRGSELHLHVDAELGNSQPAPDVQQWFLTLESDEGVFRLGSDGAPPDTLRIPPHWVPAGDRVAARLVWIQSARIGGEGSDYVALLTLDTRNVWVLEALATASEDASK